MGDSMWLYGYTDRIGSIEWTAATENVLLRNGVTSGKTLTLSQGYSVNVKGTAIGPAKVSAKVVGTTYAADYTFLVGDSAAMTSLRIVAMIPTVKVSQSLYLTSTLKDVDGFQYRGSPTWTSTDASIGKTNSANLGPGTASMAAVKAGTVKIIASFRNLRDTLVVTVVP